MVQFLYECFLIIKTIVFILLRNDFLLCFYCLAQSKKGTLLAERNKEETYISKGFRSWKKAPKCFEEHQNSHCHRAAASYHVVQSKDIGVLMNQNLADSRKVNRSYLISIMKCLRYLARQGIAIQGTHGADNFTQLLKLMGTKDTSVIDRLSQASQKFTHHEVQNELLDIMAKQVLSKKVETIRANDFYSIMCDEGTDCSNLEQLSFDTRTVDDDLEIHEDFLGFYEVDNIKSATIVAAIKDILLRFNLSLDFCRGQIYDGASNMVGKRSGVATQISAIQPKALTTHCFGHSLSLAVKDLTANCKILGDTMGTVGEITVPIKFSPKREKMLGSLIDNVEGVEETDKGDSKGASLDKLCATRWTVRANCFQKIIDRYSSLQQLWEACLEESLTRDVRSRIIGCQCQMKTFAFFFGLCLGQRLYSLTDNLSKALQNEKLSAVSGHRIALLTKDTLINMRNEESFKMFFGVILKKAANHPQIEHPTVPRKRSRPNYSILNYVEGHPSAEGHYPATVEDHYRSLYYDAVDDIIQAHMTRFDQPSFKAFCAMEQLLLKGIEGLDVGAETAEVQKIYGDDINFGSLSTEFAVLKTICKEEKPIAHPRNRQGA